MRSEYTFRKPAKAAARILCLLLCFLFVAPLCACNKSGVSPIASTDEESRTVLTVEGFDVPYELYRYFYLNYKNAMSGGDDGYFSDPAKVETLKTSTLNSIKGVYAVLALCKEYNISISEKTIQDEVQTYIESIVDEYAETDADGNVTKDGFEDYKKGLAENYMTDSVCRLLVGVDKCESELYYTMLEAGVFPSDEQEIIDYIKGDNFVHFIQVMISNDEGDSVSDNRKRAGEILEKAKSGEDFTALVSKYSEDYAMTSDGYYFTKRELLTELEDAVFALKVGEISDVVENANGFYIMKRLEKDDAYIMKNYETLKAQYLSSIFYGIIDESRDLCKVTTTAYYDSLGIDSIK